MILENFFIDIFGINWGKTVKQLSQGLKSKFCQGLTLETPYSGNASGFDIQNCVILQGDVDLLVA